jgi:uncharacterized protein YacL
MREPRSLFRNFDLGIPPPTIRLMGGKIRSWLDEHPVTKIVFRIVELIFALVVALVLIQLVPRLLTGNWCP